MADRIINNRPLESVLWASSLEHQPDRKADHDGHGMDVACTAGRLHLSPIAQLMHLNTLDDRRCSRRRRESLRWDSAVTSEARTQALCLDFVTGLLRNE